MREESSLPHPVSKIKIKIEKDGPYLVEGCPGVYQEFIIPDEYGASVEYKRGRRFDTDLPAALCRCGRSDNKPYCDGMHAKTGWDGTETASREPYDAVAREYDGPMLTLSDEEDLCAVARFCHIRDTNVWKQTLHGNTEEIKEETIRKTLMCPSGRLTIENAQTGISEEKPLFQELVVLEDPSKNVSGPIWVKGGITIVGADDVMYERRNRVTLCRCGQSQNKPFCDATHLEAGWQDGLY